MCVQELHAAGLEQPWQQVAARLETTGRTIKIGVSDWKSSKTADDRILDPNYVPKGWKKAGAGFVWPEGGEHWLRGTFTMPGQVNGTPVAGSTVIFHATVKEYAHIYINGKHENYFRNDKGEALLSTHAAPGEEYVILIKGINRLGPGIFADAHVTFSALDEPGRRARAYTGALKTMDLLTRNRSDRDAWIATMNESAALVDLAALESGDTTALLASMDRAEQTLAGFEKVAKEYTIYLHGHSHLDLAYRWDYHDGETAWINTVDTITKLFDEYPDFIFSQTQAHGYKWLEDDAPEINGRMHKWFDTGRWEITGGTWSEHDSNLPSGEGLVRQFLYGKRYFREKFGRDVTVAWLPDVFGFMWSLPQIMAKSGMTGFYTTKINWNDTNKFPYNIFWWEGPDGSRILSYFPVGGTSESVDAADMIEQMQTVEARHGIKEHMVVFGMGDHGGGVSRTHLNRAMDLRRDPAYPNIVFISTQDYFKHLHELSKTNEFPVFRDELYLEYHRGTYTSQAAVKRGNRVGEILEENAEKFASIAALFGQPYPYARIFDGWYIIMLNHMHDILPGSHIPDVSDDAARDYAAQQATANEVIHESLAVIAAQADTRGQGAPVVLFNPVGWTRDAVIELPISPSFPPSPGIVDDSGAALPFQIVSDAFQHKSLLFVARSLPPLGYAVYRVRGGMQEPENTDIAIDKGIIENKHIKITVDMETGALTSMTHKKSGREFINEQGGNFIQFYKDDPEKYDAWNIRMGEEIPSQSGKVELVEKGPVRATVKFQRKIGNSEFVQYISVYENVPYAEGRIEADWVERQVIAKLAFNLSLKNDTAWFHIPFAAIPRAAVPINPQDEARWEVSGHKWLDYTDDNAGYGLALLNDSKYGFDVRGSRVRMTLLKGAIEPDPEADMGHHSIRYALLPHEKDWRAAGVPHAGDEFNAPAHILITDSHTGALPARHAFYSCNADNVIISAVKQAEDRDGTILRVYESTGKGTAATVTLPRPALSVQETNLIEDAAGALEPSGNKLSFNLSPYEIKTFKIVFKN
jgi:alpha-mannosidase